MKKEKCIAINGVKFELDGECKLGTNFRHGTASIYDAYKKPSVSKIDVWESWGRWCREMETCELWVSSSNSNYFSIEGVCRWHGIPYFLRITYAHNRAYKVVTE